MDRQTHSLFMPIFMAIVIAYTNAHALWALRKAGERATWSEQASVIMYILLGLAGPILLWRNVIGTHDYDLFIFQIAPLFGVSLITSSVLRRFGAKLPDIAPTNPSIRTDVAR